MLPSACYFSKIVTVIRSDHRCKPTGAYGRFWHTGGMASCGMASPGMAMCGMGRPGMTRCGMGSPGMAKCGMGSWHLVLPEIVRVRVITLNGIAK